MSKGIIAVIDNNQAYSRNLCDYLDRHCGVGYTTACFSSIEDFYEFPHKNTVRFLLVNESYIPMLDGLWTSLSSGNPPYDNAKLSIDNIYILTDSRYKEDICISPMSDTRIKSIYMYQSADNICKLIYEAADCVASGFSSTGISRLSNIYGVYSPIKRCGRTSFSLALAMVLSLRAPTLFISFDENSGDYLSSQSSDKTVSDVLTSFLEHPEGIYSYVHSSIVTVNGLDILMPPRYSQDIRELSTDTISSFIRSLNNCEYVNIVIDFSDTTKDIVSHLIQCKKVYMPVVEEDISRCKITSFRKASKQVNSAFENVDITEVYVPTMDYCRDDSGYINQLMLSPITGYINGLLTDNNAFIKKYDR